MCRRVKVDITAQIVHRCLLLAVELDQQLLAALEEGILVGCRLSLGQKARAQEVPLVLLLLNCPLECEVVGDRRGLTIIVRKNAAGLLDVVPAVLLLHAVEVKG